MATEWNYYITYVDEFVQRQLIDNVDAFKEAYKNPDEFCCLFVLEPDFTNFLFVPYPEEELFGLLIVLFNTYEKRNGGK